MSGTITHSWNGTVLTVTSDSGTSSADLKGAKGDTGIRGPQGAQGVVDTSKVYTIGNPPTAAEVGAKASDWMPTLAELGAAPAGFGLGEYPTIVITNPDTISKSGFYKAVCNFSEYYQNITAWLEMIASSEGYATQIAYTDLHNGIKLRRYKIAGIWQPWEWENPPLGNGIEFRTTERWQGKVIYTTLANIGALPNSANGNATINCSAKYVIRDFMTIQEIASGRTFTDDPTFTYYCGVNTSGTVYCNMKSNSNLSAYNGIIQLWYTRD